MSAAEVLEGKRRWVLLEGNCVEMMRSLPENSVDAVCTDPPYGLEFMGAEWDRLVDSPRQDDPDAVHMAKWEGGGGFSKPGIGERQTAWPSYSSTSAANLTCETCGGRKRGKNKCSCEQPKWKAIGPRRSEVDRANRGTLTNMTNPDGSQKFKLKAPAFDLSAASSSAMQRWHYEWAKEAFRVLKPGGHLVCFGGTRTHHRLWCAMEDAGFEIRDMIGWVYGSGFPKSLDVSKAIDKAAGAVRSVTGLARGHVDAGGVHDDDNYVARQWDGWGTALKPAIEPILLARKPMSGSVSANVLKHGTGAINVDGCRVQTGDNLSGGAYAEEGTDRREGYENWRFKRTGGAGEYVQPMGRWPSNLVISHTFDCVLKGTKMVPAPVINRFMDGMKPFGEGEGHPYESVQTGDAEGMEEIEDWECPPVCPVREMNEQSGYSATKRIERPSDCGGNTWGGTIQVNRGARGHTDTGGAARFFRTFGPLPESSFVYFPKADRGEREAGLEGMEEQRVSYMNTHGGNAEKGETWHPVDERTGKERDRFATKARNTHPTVKPVDLMAWLCRLVTPPGGVVLDPFTGSGSTGIAALKQDFRFIGIEKQPEYVVLSRRRIEGDAPLFNLT